MKKSKVDQRAADVDKNAVGNFEQIILSIPGFIMQSKIGWNENYYSELMEVLSKAAPGSGAPFLKNNEGPINETGDGSRKVFAVRKASKSRFSEKKDYF